MRISKLIKTLKKIKKEHGDIGCGVETPMTLKYFGLMVVDGVEVHPITIPGSEVNKAAIIQLWDSQK